MNRYKYDDVCSAVGDPVAMQSALERYDDIDFTFSGSREGKLLKVGPSPVPLVFFMIVSPIHVLKASIWGRVSHPSSDSVVCRSWWRLLRLAMQKSTQTQSKSLTA